MNEMEIGTFEAKNKLSALIQMASRGKKIWICNRGKRVALLSSGMNNTPPSAKTLIESFHAIRSKAKRGDESLKSLITEGRK